MSCVAKDVENMHKGIPVLRLVKIRSNMDKAANPYTIRYNLLTFIYRTLSNK
jgi:hypothetical protein